jgi:hypothetical protein
VHITSRTSPRPTRLSHAFNQTVQYIREPAWKSSDLSSAFSTHPPLLNQNCSKLHKSPLSFSLTSPILDRIRAFRRRHESPSPTPTPDEPRSRSPGWLSRMDRLRSSTKRAHSPVALSPQTHTVPQMDGSCFGKPAKAQSTPGTPAPPEMPLFLQLTEEGKFSSI